LITCPFFLLWGVSFMFLVVYPPFGFLVFLFLISSFV
jgi:hypothetical protein